MAAKRPSTKNSKTAQKRGGAKATTKTTKTAKKSASTRSAGSRSRNLSRYTTDHQEIRHWAEERGGVPACVRGTGSSEDVGIIRIEFPTGSEPSLEEISWDEWFEKFDENGLALTYQEKTAEGEPSRFNKLVKRERARTA